MINSDLGLCSMNAEIIFFECFNVLKYVFINMATRYDGLENQRKGCFSQHKSWFRACPRLYLFKEFKLKEIKIVSCHRALFVRVFEGRPCFLVLLKYALALPEHLLKAKMVGNEHWASLHLTDILEIGFEYLSSWRKKLERKDSYKFLRWINVSSLIPVHSCFFE